MVMVIGGALTTNLNYFKNKFYKEEIIMQNTALETIFTESYISDVEAGLDHLSKVCIESCAATAYNEVIFENALTDEVLSEADDGKSAFTGVKNVAFKAIQTLKMVFQSLFNKIRVAINEFIKNETEKKTLKAFEDYKKALKDDKDGNLRDAEVKMKAIYLDTATAFPTVVDFKTLVAGKDEHDMAKKLAALVTSGLGDNYADAKKALKDAKEVKDVTKVLLNIASYAKEDKESLPIGEILTGKKADMVTISKSVKNRYTKSVANVTKFIKDSEAKLKTAKTDDECKDIKEQVILAQKIISFLHAAFIGQLKWAVAANKNAMAAIKSAKAGGVEESAFTEFMGLQLL